MSDGITLTIRDADRLHKVTKLFFGSDGSYYVAVPYHKVRRAVLYKRTVNYDLATPTHVDHECKTPESEAIDIGVTDNERLKLSHHPDGFVQFSGQGIVSGRRADGTAKGIGVQSWPLESPCLGPSFGIFIRRLDEFETTEDEKLFAFELDSIPTLPGCNSLVIEGHYFPPLWRRFIQQFKGKRPFIQIQHPAGAVLSLPVILMPDTCEIPGFFGIDIHHGAKSDKWFAELGNSDLYYSLNGSGGNLRTNSEGHTIADTISAAFGIRDDVQPPGARDLEYRPQQ